MWRPLHAPRSAQWSARCVRLTQRLLRGGRALVGSAALASSVVLPGCSVVVDTEPLTAGCEPDEKACDGRCVSRLDAEYGCGAASCLPCVLSNATSICDLEEHCAIAVCAEGHDDCDLEPDNGCEINVDTDVDHCGGCDAPACEVPGAYPACARGKCAIRKCLPGYRDCNREDVDGCETRLTSEAPDAGDASAPVCNPWQ